MRSRRKAFWLLAARAAGKSWAKVSAGAGANKEKPRDCRAFSVAGDLNPRPPGYESYVATAANTGFGAAASSQVL